MWCCTLLYIFALFLFLPHIHTHTGIVVAGLWFHSFFFFPFIIHVNRVSTRKSVNNLVDIMRYHQRLTNSLIYYRKRNVTYLTFYIGISCQNKTETLFTQMLHKGKKKKSKISAFSVYFDTPLINHCVVTIQSL